MISLEIDREIINAAYSWEAEGTKLALAVVVKTWGSSPRQIGSRMIVNAEGDFSGSISGGCVESAVIRECIELLKNDATCETGEDGSVESIILGGTLPYLYTWNNGSVQSEVYNLSEGSYSVIVTDSNNCLISTSLFLHCIAIIP